jgi:hypothetical protein
LGSKAPLASPSFTGTVSAGDMTLNGSGNTTLVVSNSSTGRATMKLLSLNNDATDLFFGSNNDTRWSFSGRALGEGYDFKFFRYNGSWSEVMVLDWANGRVGIGTNSPEAPLHVYGNPFTANGINISSYLRPTNNASVGGPNSVWSSSYTDRAVSIFAEYSIFSKYGYVGASDKRIKENIVEIDDNLALKKVRDISCCWYNYKDKVEKGDGRVLGFIAQQVKEHLPEAVGRIKSIIPNEMKKIHSSWNETKLSSNDLQDVSGIKYRFYVSNDVGDEEKRVELVGDENNCFTFKEKWGNVFCYGKEVDDFHTLDKQKLFALNFSATQEIDKIQQAEKAKLAATETKLAAAETKLAAAETKLAAAETEITTLKTQLAAVLARLDALENA